MLNQAFPEIKVQTMEYTGVLLFLDSFLLLCLPPCPNREIRVILKSWLFLNADPCLPLLSSVTADTSVGVVGTSLGHPLCYTFCWVLTKHWHPTPVPLPSLCWAPTRNQKLPSTKLQREIKSYLPSMSSKSNRKERNVILLLENRKQSCKIYINPEKIPKVTET